MLWTHKYRPKFEDIAQDTKQLHDYVATYSRQKKKALLLHGPTGSGKTAAVHALAGKLGLELAEVNASDFRTADEINAKIGQALKQRSLFSQGKLIFVDELDGIAGREDRGGIGALADLIATARFPVVLAANDAYDERLNSLRSKCVLVEFPAMSGSSMVPVLKSIVDAEKLSAGDDFLKALARRSGGDLRGAIIDLQVLSNAGFSLEALNTLHERERSESIMQALVKILKSTDPSVALSAFDSVDLDTDECLLWIDENLPKEYRQPEDLSRAYEALSRADVFRGRIRRWQYWRYLVYVNILLTAGVAVAKDKKSPAFVQYSRTQRLLKLWMAKQKYAKRQRVAGKLGDLAHCSTRKALHLHLPHIHSLFQKKHVSSQRIIEELKLDEEEVEWLGK